MVITYMGGQCFKVSFGDTTLAFNPIDKSSKLKQSKFGADVAFVTMNHQDFNGTEQVEFGGRQPFVVSGPGEYEVGEVTARGFGILTKYDGEDRYNTLYYATLEGINMLFLGSLSEAKIDPKILEEIGDVDILFIPVGGGDVLDAAAASELTVKLEPKLIIPMHYGDAELKAFLKEVGAEGTKPEEKLTLKKKDIIAMEGSVAVLSS